MTRQLTAFDAPSVKATLVPVEVKMGRRETGTIRGWNQAARRWHRTGGR